MAWHVGSPSSVPVERGALLAGVFRSFLERTFDCVAIPLLFPGRKRVIFFVAFSVAVFLRASGGGA